MAETLSSGLVNREMKSSTSFGVSIIEVSLSENELEVFGIAELENDWSADHGTDNHNGLT